MRSVCILIALFILHGCRAPLILHNTEVTTDTVKIWDVIRDTSIVVQSDSSLIRAFIECDSLGQARLREITELRSGKHVAPPHLSINQNILTAMVAVDSFSIYMQLRDRYMEQKTATIETKYVEVNKLTWWQTLWIRVAKALLGIILIFVTLRILKIK